MFLSSSVNQFVLRFRQSLFFRKDGFYVLPYLANSPKTMLDSMSWMPFVKVFHKKKLIKTSNPFFEGDLHYEELEEGLWILVSDVTFKKNVSYRLIYDNSLPADYYTLSLYYNKTRQTAPPALINNVVNEDKSWMLHKPGGKAVNGHFAGSKALFFIIYFSKTWLNKNTNVSGVFTSDRLKNWIVSESTGLYLPELFQDGDSSSEPILKAILNKGTNGVQNVLKLRANTLELMFRFIEKTRAPEANIKYDVLTNANRRKLLKAEKKISDAIFEGFPGIESLAHEVGLSATKLKNDFKATYGHSLFKYFQFRQMEAAKEMLLKDSELKVTYVAGILGYVNPGKFSATFKKCFGHLPSELNREKTN